ncbi:extracellular solute-binding protein [Cohnella soli]|uniref:Extracellular solute-binding protein n=1 Tax=Cohnella soli TaxID=425005 RepID=A0ABW0HUK6_9BACL
MKRITSHAALITTLLASTLLAACSKNNEAQSIDPSPTNTPSASSSASAEPISYEPLGKYPETVTVTQVLGFNPPEDANAMPGLTPETNGYLKDLKEMLNIELKYKWTVPADQYDQKFNLAIASGDLPDMMVVDYSTFMKFKEQGILEDLTEAYKNYASPLLKKIIESDGGFGLEAGTQDGKLLGLTKSSFGGAQVLWIRKDWLDNLHLPVPTSMEELEKVAEAFVNNDPDQNGKKDTYGIALIKNFLTGWGFDAKGFFQSNGSYPLAWLKGADGKLIPGEIQPETKAALERLNSWYKKGIIEKEFVLKDESKESEDLISGKVGISFGEWWYPNWPLNLNKDKDPKAEWIQLELPSLNGNPGKTLLSRVLSPIMVVKKGFKNPEAAIKIANLFQELQGTKYVTKDSPDYKGPSTGYVQEWFLPRYYGGYKDIYLAVNEALDANKEKLELPEDFVGLGEAQTWFDAAKKYRANPKDNTAWGMYYSRVAKDGGVALALRTEEDPSKYVLNEYYGPPTPTQVEKGASLNKLTNETFTKMIMGATPISEFDKYVGSWRKLGGDDITAEVNEWYEKNAVK